MKFYTYIILLLFNINVFCQTPTIVWQKAIGGSLYDKAEQVINTFDGGFAIIGSSQSSNFDVSSNKGGYDLWLIKTNFQGTVEWKKSLGSNADDFFYSIIQRPDSSYIVCGSSISSTGDFVGNHGHTDIWLVKFGKGGNIIWKKNYGGSLNDYSRKIINTQDGGFAIIGTTESTDFDIKNHINYNDVFLMKFKNNETIEWTKCLGGTGNDYGFAMKQSSDGGYIVCGSSNSTIAGTNHYGGTDAFVAKVNSTGVLEWQKAYGGTENDSFRTLLITESGNMVVAGETFSDDYDAINNHNSENRDYLVLYLNSVGNKIWSQCYGGNNNDYSREIINSTDGNIVLSGETYSYDGNSTFTHGSADYWIFKINHSGNIIWQKAYGGAEHDEPNCIVQTPDNGFLVVGNSASLNNGDVSGVHGDDDFWLLRLKNEENCFDKLSLNLNNITENATFKAINDIQSGVKIANQNIKVDYFSAGKIELKPGFETKVGSVFKAEIRICN